MNNQSAMESPPLSIDVTLNPKQDGAILHINCQSDGKEERWMRDKEEGSTDAKNVWLGKLGCLLKIHGNIRYRFNDPWAYTLSNFPGGYKLFAVERQVQGDNPPRKDYYLCGGHHKYRSAQEFFPHLHWLLDNAQGVEKPCICQYCDPTRTQEQINEIYSLPPGKESAKGPKGPKKHKQTRKSKGPKGVTTKRILIRNRNSLTTGPVTTPGHDWQNHRVIGHKKSHPF